MGEQILGENELNPKDENEFISLKESAEMWAIL